MIARLYDVYGGKNNRHDGGILRGERAFAPLLAGGAGLRRGRHRRYYSRAKFKYLSAGLAA